MKNDHTFCERLSEQPKPGRRASQPTDYVPSFEELGLCSELLQAIAEAGYQQPTPVQANTIPQVLRGKDVIGCAETGTGKTAAFALPTLQRVCREPARREPRALILTPTRELAVQIGESCRTLGRYLRLRSLTIFGGVSEHPQISALKKGTDILIATPGRLLDLHDRGFVALGHVQIFVLDEADRMLDMGFVKDVQRIEGLLQRPRQNLLFSATMPKEVATFARKLVRASVQVEQAKRLSPVANIAETVMFVARPDKRKLLAEQLKKTGVTRSIVFVRTKHGADRLAKQLSKENLSAVALHGNKSRADGVEHSKRSAPVEQRSLWPLMWPPEAFISMM